MNTEVIVNMLKELKLHGMAESFSGLMNTPMQMRPALNVCMSRMIEAENCWRNKARTEKLLKAAKLRYGAHIEDIGCSVARNLIEAMLAELSECSYIRRGENVLITGQTGCGKSWLVCALGRQACMLGFSTLYVNLNRDSLRLWHRLVWMAPFRRCSTGWRSMTCSYLMTLVLTP